MRLYRDRLLAVLSHELRNPLAPIRTSLDLIERTDPNSDHARRALEVISRQFAQMTRLIDDLLDITRITSGKIALQRESLDLSEITRHAVDDRRNAFLGAGVTIEVASAPAGVRVNGDRARLEQVIGNILHNARKFTPRDGKVTVSVQVESSRGEAVLSIQDTGRGISAEILPRLFEPFVQADTTLDRAMGGLGLGLALAKGLVELHGGSIRAASEGPGRGATFTITLPLDTSVPISAPEQREGNGSKGVKQRVLVIEDNVDAADALRAALELEGYEIDVAHDGPEGLQHARSFAPAVVLCDIGLPGMDGYDVARTLRGDPKLGDAVLVAVTGYGAPEDVAKAKTAGFDAHLAKPVTLDKLLRLMTKLMNGHGT